jgi:hypothetical protein
VEGERSAGVRVAVDETTILPFPAEFDGTAIEDAVGPIEWTPLADGVSRTIERLRAAQA